MHLIEGDWYKQSTVDGQEEKSIVWWWFMSNQKMITNILYDLELRPILLNVFH